MVKSVGDSQKQQLTPSQQAAVTHVDGPLLVLAGPGSGKTRVITGRIAHMVELGIDQQSILAITFTNKAANEMAERVESLVPGSRVWVSTFHRFCARLLRSYAGIVGLESNYTIFDTSDQQQLVRRILSDLDLDAVHTPPRKIAAKISHAKNNLQSAEKFQRMHERTVGDHLQAAVARVYPEYQKELLKANAVDFDDLLLHVVTLLSENPELRSKLDANFRYVLVDEYQDTNMAQYQIVSALSQNHRNLCVTGDPDQSIYGWRGAKIENIMKFESDYRDAQVIRLEQNFRSTKQILSSADRLISHNRYRKAKSLVTDNDDGMPVELLCFENSKTEADGVARHIRNCVEADGRNWSEFAVFYRVNSLSREIERALARHKIPHQVAAGVAFFARAEIKDMLSFLRLVENPADSGAFHRVVNKPARSIGKVTQKRLSDWANSSGLSLLDAAGRADGIPKMSKRAAVALKSFARMMSEFSLAASGSVRDLLAKIIDRTKFTREWEDSDSETDIARMANVGELLTAAHDYDISFEEDRSLQGFLESTSLASDVDGIDDAAGSVTLMTLHAAKGLEFPVVYLIGVEHGLIPHERSLRSEDPRELEEERRLLFVGMTRAMQQLYLTNTVERNMQGRSMRTIPSDFLRETRLVYRNLVSNDDGWSDDGMYDYDEPPTEDGSTSVESMSFDADPDTVTSQIVTPEPESASWDDEPAKAAVPELRHPQLTTAAALMNGDKRPAELPIGFAIGMKVRHPIYGLGQVVEVSGFAKRRTVTVEFQVGSRRESFVTSKCPLQPVGIG